MYNKNQYKKFNSKKILHKVKKQWVTISLALLMLIGGGAIATHVSVNADSTPSTQATNHYPDTSKYPNNSANGDADASTIKSSGSTTTSTATVNPTPNNSAQVPTKAVSQSGVYNGVDYTYNRDNRTIEFTKGTVAYPQKFIGDTTDIVAPFLGFYYKETPNNKYTVASYAPKGLDANAINNIVFDNAVHFNVDTFTNFLTYQMNNPITSQSPNPYAMSTLVLPSTLDTRPFLGKDNTFNSTDDGIPESSNINCLTGMLALMNLQKITIQSPNTRLSPVAISPDIWTNIKTGEHARLSDGQPHVGTWVIGEINIHNQNSKPSSAKPTNPKKPSNPVKPSNSTKPTSSAKPSSSTKKPSTPTNNKSASNSTKPKSNSNAKPSQPSSTSAKPSSKAVNPNKSKASASSSASSQASNQSSAASQSNNSNVTPNSAQQPSNTNNTNNTPFVPSFNVPITNNTSAESTTSTPTATPSAESQATNTNEQANNSTKPAVTKHNNHIARNHHAKRESIYLFNTDFKGLSKRNRSVVTIKGLRAYKLTRKGHYVPVKNIKPNTKLAVKRVIKFGKITKLQLANGLLVTSNKHFVSVKKNAKRINKRAAKRAIKGISASRYTRALRKSNRVLRHGRRHAKRYIYRTAKKFNKANKAEKKAYRKFARKHTNRNRKAVNKAITKLNNLVNALLK